MVKTSIEQPKSQKIRNRIDADEVIEFADAALKQKNEEDPGLPEGSTVFLVTNTTDKAGKKVTKRTAINPEHMHLEIGYVQDADGNRTPISGRARKAEGETATA